MSSRVCVDPYAYYRSRRRPLVVPRLRPLYKKEDEGKDPDRAKYDVSNTPDIRYSTDFAWEPLGHEVIEADDFMSDDGMSGPGISIGRKYAHETAQGISTPAKSLAERTEDLRPLNEEQLLLTTPWVKGFDLTAKEWCLLRVDDLSDTEWDDAALDKLVLPDERKHLIRSLAKNSSTSSSIFNSDGPRNSISEKAAASSSSWLAPPASPKPPLLRLLPNFCAYLYTQ